MAVVSYNQSSRFQLPGQYFMTDPFVTIEEMLYFLFVHKTMDRIIIPDQLIGCPGHFTIQYNQQLSGIFQLFPTHFFKNFPDTGGIIMTHHDIRPPYNYTSGRRIKYFFDKGSHSLFNQFIKLAIKLYKLKFIVLINLFFYHFICEKDAVQMIDFMLKNHSRKSPDSIADRFPRIPILHLHLEFKG